jgi:hypothetical protein
MKQFWLEAGLLITLISCAPAIQPEAQPQGLRPRSELEVAKLVPANNHDAPLIDEQAGNCPVNEIEIPGEGYRVKGGIGGLAIAPNPVGITPGNPLTVGQHIFDQAAPDLTERAAIIVVDDFNGGPRQPGVYFLDQQEGRALADLSGGATETEVQGLEANRQYSHGALVFNHTLALLSAHDTNPEVSQIRVPILEEDAVISIPIVIFTKLNVTVVALDTQDFDTEVISGRLRETIRALGQQQNIDRFAVNLSFGLVPCSVLADFGAANREGMTFEAYQQEVLDANGLDAGAFRQDLVALLTTPVGTDPLVTDVARNRELNGGSEISYLAAAGNYALPYALYPGYWSEFVSVSAQNLASSTPVRDPDYSNLGEVLLPGGYYTLTAYDPVGGSWRDYPNLSVAGTSFAAPVLSVFTAFDFTNPAPRCARRSPDIASPLAFFKTDPPVSLPLPDLDVTLADALGRYCP